MTEIDQDSEMNLNAVTESREDLNNIMDPSEESENSEPRFKNFQHIKVAKPPTYVAPSSAPA